MLGKRNEDLTDQERELLKDLLHYSDLLRDVYEWKETFIEWYNCSSSFAYAKQRFIRWRKQGEKMNHAAVRSCLKT
ncbi:transposase, partial [Aneurinibacillus tyrosinisolvens]|uniref:transposase n=1 Tax=Aneurinibacillus tyrosinisolvens TaxID=1443435 RepID=UPI0034E1E0B6